MKLYKLKMQKGGKGVFKMSTVKNPAIEKTLLHFNKEEQKKLCFADEEKRIFYAPAMIPDLQIFRKNIHGEPAMVTYDADFVEEAQINYFRNNGNAENNINHSDENTEGLFPFESWIIHDYETDKAKTLGLDAPTGSWIMGYKVDNDDTWARVKSGELDGLSIEATNLEHIFKHNIEMKKPKEKSFIDTLFDTLFNMKKEYDEVEEIKEEETPDPKEDETKEEVPTEQMEEPKEEETPETPETPAEEPKEEETPEPSEKEQLLMDEIISLKQTIAELEADKVKEATVLEEMSTQLEKFKKETPGAEPIPNGPTVTKHEIEKPYSKMTNAEKMRHNRNV